MLLLHISKVKTYPVQFSTYRDNLSTVCSTLHGLILGCTPFLNSCYTTQEVDSIVKRHTNLMNSAMRVIVPNFDISRSCNNDIEKTLEKPFGKSYNFRNIYQILSSNNSNKTYGKFLSDIPPNFITIANNATSPVTKGTFTIIVDCI